jgi:hypothetical protein
VDYRDTVYRHSKTFTLIISNQRTHLRPGNCPNSPPLFETVMGEDVTPNYFRAELDLDQFPPIVLYFR